MKNKLLKTSAIALAFVSIAVQPASVFAAETNYGIEYSGGNPLGESNVTINKTMIEEMNLLVGSGVPDGVTFSQGNWERGYFKAVDESCRSVHYYKFYDGHTISENDDVWFSMKKDNYTMKVQFVNIALHNVTTSETNALAMRVPDYGTVEANGEVYADPQCTTQISGIRKLGLNTEGEVFYETKITLERDKIDNFASKNLFFEISDFDNAQSFKILNPSNYLNKNNMFAKDAADLQPESGDLKNMYVASGDNKYIYSQYNASGTTVATNDVSNIYVKLTKETQEEGLRAVLGFAGSAGSRLSFFAKQYVVDYVSDEHGDITGIDTETVIKEDNPAGSSSRASDGYEFEYWIADKNVTLEDGTVIPAGQAITPEQVKLVVVNDNITFTAVHAEIPEDESGVLVPDTGQSTGNMSAVVISVSVIGVGLGALMLAMIPKFAHRKIGFKK